MSVRLSALSSFASASSPRLETAVSTLRNRFEQHQRQEHRLHSYYLGLQDSWQSQLQQMNSQLTMLEGLLATWVATPSTPQLSVVTAVDGE